MNLREEINKNAYNITDEDGNFLCVVDYEDVEKITMDYAREMCREQRIICSKIKFLDGQLDHKPVVELKKEILNVSLPEELRGEG